jgi:hypothetical protein
MSGKMYRVIVHAHIDYNWRYLHWELYICIESCKAFKIITDRVESLYPHPLSANKKKSMG